MRSATRLAPEAPSANGKRGPALPHSYEAEVSVLGGVLHGGLDAFARVADLLRPEDFQDRRHQAVYATMLRLYSEGGVIDPVTVHEALKATAEADRVGGVAYLSELLDAAPTAANLEYHARIVADHARLRALYAAASDTMRDVIDPEGRPVSEILDRAHQRILGVVTDRSGGAVRARDLVMPMFGRLEERVRSGGGMTGVPTGLHDLDAMTGGLQAGDLILLAARPSMGKTALAVGMAYHAAVKHNRPVLVFSLEMSKEQIVQRMFAYATGCDLGKIIRGQVTWDDIDMLRDASGPIDAAPLWIDDRSDLTVTQIRAGARRLKAERKDLALVIVDYAQLVAGRGENRTQEVADVSRGLKAMARELGVPVVALSQLSRAPAQRTDHRPQLSDLRDSGALEQDADLVIFVHRPEQYMTPQEAAEKDLAGKAELIIGKHRNGPTGVVEAYFRAPCARFESLERRRER